MKYIRVTKMKERTIKDKNRVSFLGSASHPLLGFFFHLIYNFKEREGKNVGVAYSFFFIISPSNFLSVCFFGCRQHPTRSIMVKGG
jgi:hypothetical protein